MTRGKDAPGRLAQRFCAGLLSLALVLGPLLTLPAPAHAASRIKDIADFEGVRSNYLIGYGLVVGLLNTGDDLKKKDPYTLESVISMLERLGLSTRPLEGAKSQMDSGNVAAVLVTATLPAFGRQGSRIDVTVSALGTATSLMGGTLLVTPLIGADGQVYAVAQGKLQVGGFAVAGAAETIQKGVPTSGRIPNGAMIEQEVPFDLANMEAVRISLRNPDFTTGRRIAQAVNAFLGVEVATLLDPGTVHVPLHGRYQNRAVDFFADVEQLLIEPDLTARVVIDEATGTIVIGENVRISTVAVAQGALTIRVTETPQVSQPTPFSLGGETAVVPRTDIQVDEQSDRRLAVVNSGVSLQDLVDSLNALGVGPRDMITILQAIRASGALQADIEVM
ncbi:flagellar basal body P-ring protein FlgI [Phaeovibrio sulfidiphilus]|uniref:Flagellar P-ring protein n=1 Tax=Phaeovibrio sulfidiphilus TaxID=1220600 RepID=A0A8J6YW85_9PROT|nr:flagellar basal body P-ring protein FlgI [Phaeovibrio sulfidiphilus]MBE1237589.1 flagellar basal body P-ring protein FlgI [Phaeovibrio sulfidiphilus]